MWTMAIIDLILLILPFILGAIHIQMTKHVNPVVVYYRYFLFFNLVLAGGFVALRMLFAAHNVATQSGFMDTPMIGDFGVAILSIVLTGLFTMFVRGRLNLAGGIVWVIFLILSSLIHIYQLSYHEIKYTDLITIHIIWNVVVAVILLIFLFLVRE